MQSQVVNKAHMASERLRLLEFGLNKTGILYRAASLLGPNLNE